MCCIIYLQEQRIYQHPPKKTPHFIYAQMCHAPEWVLNSTLPSIPLLWEKEQAQMCYAPEWVLNSTLPSIPLLWEKEQLSYSSLAPHTI